MHVDRFYSHLKIMQILVKGPGGARGLSAGQALLVLSCRRQSLSVFDLMANLHPSLKLLMGNDESCTF